MTAFGRKNMSFLSPFFWITWTQRAHALEFKHAMLRSTKSRNAFVLGSRSWTWSILLIAREPGRDFHGALDAGRRRNAEALWDVGCGYSWVNCCFLYCTIYKYIYNTIPF